MFQNLNIFSSITKSVLSNIFAKDTIIRSKAKKASSCTRNKGGRAKPKHRGPKVFVGSTVPAGTILFLQRKLRVHPGLNVGIGRNLTIYAREAGKVVVSCEKFEPRWDNSFVSQGYSHQKGQTILKKYYNIIPEPQHNRFNLINLI